jgi:hypothetical protein
LDCSPLARRKVPSQHVDKPFDDEVKGVTPGDGVEGSPPNSRRRSASPTRSSMACASATGSSLTARAFPRRRERGPPEPPGMSLAMSGFRSAIASNNVSGDPSSIGTGRNDVESRYVLDAQVRWLPCGEELATCCRGLRPGAGERASGAAVASAPIRIRLGDEGAMKVAVIRASEAWTT